MSGWGMAQSGEPSLADLSKQARERKAKTPKPARLITNADLKNFQNAPVSMSKAPEAPQPAEQAKGEVKAPDSPEAAAAPGKDLSEWKAKFQAAVMDYKNAINKGLVLQLRMNSMTNSFYAQTDDAARARFATEIDQTEKDIAANKDEVVAAEKAIEDLKAEARAAGVEEGDIVAMVGQLPKPTSINEIDTSGDQKKENQNP